MSGFDILTLVGEPWNDSAGVFGGIDVSVTDTASLPTSKFLEFVLNGASIYKVLKTGETIISDATGTSLGGIKLAGSAGEMALTSQIDATTSAPAEALRYSWEDTAHVGTDPVSGSVLQGMGASNFSIEGAAKITHIAGSSAYAWSGLLGTRLIWTGNTAATNDGRTIDFTNVGQTNRASPIVSVSAANAADDLIQFGLSDGTNWTVAAEIDAAGRGQFQMLDLPEQGAPGDPAAGTARIYGKNVNGTSKVAFRDSTGAETVLGSTILVSGGIVTTSTPVASFSQTWNEGSTVFNAITADVTDTGSNATSSLLDLKLNSGSVFQVRKSGETVITNSAGTSGGGIALRGGNGEMALTSQIDPNTGLPADAFRWYWEDPNHVGSDPASASVLRGMGLNRMSLESSAAFIHISQTARYEWEGLGSDRLLFLGYEAGTAKGKTFDFTNYGQTPTRASPVMSISAADANDDLMHFGLSDGTSNWTVAAKIDAAGRGQFQMLDLPEQGAPGNPAAATARVYGKSVNGASKVAFRDSTGAETVLGSTISVSGGTVTTSTPFASFSQTWNDSSVIFSGITANVTDTASRVTSSLIDLKVNSGSVFQVRKSGETVISNVAGTSRGGIALRGNAGEMALTSMIDPNSGLPADAFRWYWEDSNHVGSDGASVSVLRGMGRNRMSLESAGAFVHIAQTARYEWEGLGSDRLIFLGYEAGSARGKTFDFNNFGQTPTRASPVVSISVDEAHPEDDPLHIGTLNNSGVWKSLSRFDGTGGLHVPRVDAVGTTGTTPRYTAALDTDTELRAQIGLDSADRGMIKLGIGGTTAPDVMLSRGPFAGCLDISNGTNPSQIRIYRTYGADAEFWNMTWRLTSPPWASIRTNWSGNGAARNICIEPALLGLGVPVGNGSNIPALKRVATQLQVRLGDDSDFTAIRGKLTTADSAVPEVIVATHTLTLYDASGTAYKVPCVAT